MESHDMSLVDHLILEGTQVCKKVASDAVFEAGHLAKDAVLASEAFVEHHGSTLLHDTAIAFAAFIFTHLMYKATKSYLSKNLPTWNKVSSFTQNRLSCEIAMLPTRFLIFLCCVPAILNAFAAEDFWTGLDTSRTVLVCCLMAGAYAYDLLIERNDVLSLIHHCFGPAMLLWIRSSFATYTADDAHMDRLLVSFIFFGAGVGGTITTMMLVFMKLMKPQLSQETLYQAVSLLSWVLTANTFASTMFGSWYMLIFHDTLMNYWGWWCYLPLILCSFEFYLQWRWALRFQHIADELGEKAGHHDAAEIKIVPDVLSDVVTMLPGVDKPTLKAKSLGLAVLVSSWAISYFGVFANSISKTVFQAAM